MPDNDTDTATTSQWMSLAEAAYTAGRVYWLLDQFSREIPKERANWRPPLDFDTLTQRVAALASDLEAFGEWVGRVTPDH